MEKVAMRLDQETTESGRRRIARVFRYLEALNQVRNPVKRHVRDQPWLLWFRDLPDHPAILTSYSSEAKENGDSFIETVDVDGARTAMDFILKVRRPSVTEAPAPPAKIADWLRRGWNDVNDVAEAYQSRADEADRNLIIRFEDDPERLRLFQAWRERRDAWARTEKPAREALKVFERLYELHAQIERESERLELVLGDGIFNWRRPEGGGASSGAAPAAATGVRPAGPGIHPQRNRAPRRVVLGPLSRHAGR